MHYTSAAVLRSALPCSASSCVGTPEEVFQLYSPTISILSMCFKFPPPTPIYTLTKCFKFPPPKSNLYLIEVFQVYTPKIQLYLIEVFSCISHPCGHAQTLPKGASSNINKVQPAQKKVYKKILGPCPREPVATSIKFSLEKKVYKKSL